MTYSDLIPVLMTQAPAPEELTVCQRKKSKCATGAWIVLKKAACGYETDNEFSKNTLNLKDSETMDNVSSDSDLE